MSLPQNIKFILLPSFLNREFEFVFNKFTGASRMFESVFIEPEKHLMWVNYQYVNRVDAKTLIPRSVVGYYFPKSSIFNYKHVKTHKYVAKNSPINSLDSGLANKHSVVKSLRIGIVDRDSAYRGANPLRDTQQEELVKLCRLLKKHNYIVIRLGNRRNFRLPDDCVDLDVPFSEQESKPNFELEIIRSLDACITWKTGYQEVPLLFRIPTVMLDEFWRNDKPRSVIVPPAYLHIAEKRVLLVPEMLTRFGMNFEDNVNLQDEVKRIPTNPSIAIASLKQLLNSSAHEEQKLDTIKEHYIKALKLALNSFNGKPQNDINDTKFHLERLLLDLEQHPFPISHEFLTNFQSEIGKISGHGLDSLTQISFAKK